MKILLELSAALLIASVAPAYGQHKIALYSDPAHTSTVAIDEVPGELTLYVVLESLRGGAAVSFKIAASPGFTGVWLGETSAFLTIGTSQVGMTVSFPACHLNTRVLEIRYTLLGTSLTCSTLDVVADPQFDLFGGPPVVVECDHGYTAAVGGRLTVNADSSCAPVPVAITSWGRIKALYR